MWLPLLRGETLPCVASSCRSASVVRKMVATTGTELFEDSVEIVSVGVRATTCSTALQIVATQGKEDTTVKITSYFLSTKI